jgi:hypothetical protein
MIFWSFRQEKTVVRETPVAQWFVTDPTVSFTAESVGTENICL